MKVSAVTGLAVREFCGIGARQIGAVYVTKLILLVVETI